MNAQKGVATTGPVAQLGLSKGVTSLIAVHQVWDETTSSYLSCLSS